MMNKPHLLATLSAALGFTLVACTDPTAPPENSAEPEPEPTWTFTIVSTDETAGTRGEIRSGDAGIVFETTRVARAGETHLKVLLDDLGGTSLGPDSFGEDDRVALVALEHAATDAGATGALAEDLNIVAVAAGFLASSAVEPPAGARTTTRVKTCTPDSGAHRAYSQFVYSIESGGPGYAVYRTTGYWIRYERNRDWQIGSHSNEYVVGGEWSWGSPDSAPVGKWAFRSLSKRGVGEVSIKAVFDRANASDPGCTMFHRLVYR